MTTEPLTAIINVAPALDPAVGLLKEEAIRLKDFAEKRIIASDADLKPAVDDLSLIANVKKALATKKAEWLKPIKSHIDAVSAVFEEITTPLGQADIINRKKVLDYRAEQQRIADEAEAINRAKLELAQREAKLNDGVITVDLTPIEVPAPIAKVRTDAGLAGTMKVTKWELIDFKAVPDEYKTLDSARITKVVKAGGSIPGIKVWEEATLRVTANR